MIQNKETKVTGNLLELSDLFRRAAFSGQAEEIKTMVDLTSRLGKNLTWIYPEYPLSNGVNKNAAKIIADTLKLIDSCARSLGLDEVVLPVRVRSFDGQLIRKLILDKNSFDTHFSFQKSPYRENVSSVGLIHADIETILDRGKRGVAYIHDSAKSRWDREPRLKPQMEFNF